MGQGEDPGGWLNDTLHPALLTQVLFHKGGELQSWKNASKGLCPRERRLF